MANKATEIADKWFQQKSWKPHAFQQETWQQILEGKSGLLNAPTGCGKTYAIWFGIIQAWALKNGVSTKSNLHCLWITPLRALSKEIELATSRVSADLDLPYKIALRSGDTSTKEKADQKKNAPNAIITTPESVHVLFSQKGYADYFSFNSSAGI